MHEASMEKTEHGLQPQGDGWFIVNARDLAWATGSKSGTWCVFEAADAPSTTLGIGIHVLPAGETPGMYHREDQQEGFLVLSGECLLIVEGEERTMRAWDYFHCPPGTDHITIGADGDEPCAIVMVGTRSPDEQTVYSPDPVAARHGAAVAVESTDAREVYADRPPFSAAPAPFPLP